MLSIYLNIYHFVGNSAEFKIKKLAILVSHPGRFTVSGSIRSIKCMAGVNVQCKKDGVWEYENKVSRYWPPPPTGMRGI